MSEIKDKFLPETMGKYLGSGVCLVCGKSVAITKTGKAIHHTLPFNGDYYPACSGSLQQIDVVTPRGEKKTDKYRHITKVGKAICAERRKVAEEIIRLIDVKTAITGGGNHYHIAAPILKAAIKEKFGIGETQ